VFSDPALAHEGALRGLGIAILPRALVHEDLARGALVPALLAYNPLNVPLYAVYPDGRRPPTAQEALLTHLARAYGATTETPTAR
jgi:DNA-binding transcriptional LysR family regulator